MPKGAADHHIPTELSIKLLGELMLDVKEAIENLKTTLTNLNVMPPVTETPWAFKLIGKAGIKTGLALELDPLEEITLFQNDGTGQILHLILQGQGPETECHYHARLTIEIDDVEIFSSEVSELFAGYAPIEPADLGLSGIVLIGPFITGVRWDVPIYYSTKIKVKWKNMSLTDTGYTSFTVWYTNLP